MKNELMEKGIVTAPGTIRFERLLPGTPERLWAWLTEPEKRALWLAGGPMEPFAGGRVGLVFDNSLLTGEFEPAPPKYKEHEQCSHSEGKIITWRPHELLAYTWGDGSEVSFELVPKGSDVLLVIIHSKIRNDVDVQISIAAGWHTHTGILEDRLGGTKARNFWATHMEKEEFYRKEFATG